MNSLNIFWVGIAEWTAIDKVDKEQEVETDVFVGDRADRDTLGVDIALGLIDEEVILLASEDTEMLEREDLWELLAASFLVLVWVINCYKRTWQYDGAIQTKKKRWKVIKK